MKKKIIISIGILVIAGAAFGFYLFNKPHQSILDETPDFEVASSTIIGEFEKNEDAANKKFNGKIVEVVGIISEISKDEQGKLNITLQGQDIAGIGCVFEKAAQLKAAALIEGQEVRIKGICAGILMDVVLVDCVVVDKNN